ncbi:replication initiation protein [Senegalia sp. (in: firmicutes)]|uniref:replication initiation protein n=1 Tax=Senegalia sp. (in: firmicutes) TaxID=1924098 RepID=UPI003F9C51DE
MGKNLVVKSNNLIEARYKLSLNEQKLILYAIGKLDRNKNKFNILQMQTSDFIKLLNTSELRYTEIRKLVTNLMGKQVKITTDIGELIANWVSSIEYIKNSGVIELEFSGKLIPYLLQLKEQFTRYELENILYLQNKYSIRVYELLKQYEKIGKREIKLGDLRNYLGIEKNQYKRFSNFENRVLKTTKEEINEHTDLLVDYDKLKTGRRITSILFTIESKDQDKKVYIDFLNEFYDIKEMKLKMGLKNENFSPEQIMNLYEKAVEMAGNEDTDLFEYIRLNYNHIKGKARNKYSYLLNALEKDYASAIGQINLDYYIKK